MYQRSKNENEKKFWVTCSYDVCLSCTSIFTLEVFVDAKLNEC